MVGERRGLLYFHIAPTALFSLGRTSRSLGQSRAQLAGTIQLRGTQLSDRTHVVCEGEDRMTNEELIH